MKFSIVSLRNTQRMAEVIDVFGHDIDNNKPDFVITYGGDGTILFSERKYPGVPKITIRGSSIGSKCIYLEEELEDVIIKLDSEEYTLKEESKLETTFQGSKYLSLNETQLHNSSPIKAVRFSVYIDDTILFENVIGDGVIIATPFGSSAYYSSVGGEKFDNGIGIALNNAYNIRHKPVVVNKDFDHNVGIEILQRSSKDIKSSKHAKHVEHVKASKDTNDGLLLFDNDIDMLRVKGGDRISVRRSKETAKFVTI